jgi:nanoRNase/pAp phosphatase (c-di-AMP/oligoRNAs hydrolase)
VFVRFKYHIESQDINCIHIFLHHNADPDALCAAESIGELTKLIKPSISYKIYSDGINTSAKRILNKFNIRVQDTLPTEVSEDDLIVTVDIGNFSQLGKFKYWVQNSKLSLLLFDHHDAGEMHDIATLSIYDKFSASTCIIIAKAYREYNLLPSPKIATLLLCGHIYDSRRFIYGSTSTTFQLISFLLDSEGDFEIANSLLQNVMPISERIARLKAARRLTYKVVLQNILVVTSSVAAFESSAARNFVTMGADVVLVIAEKDDEIRGSGRTHLGDQVNMGEILSKLAHEFGGSGGGHSAAAGLNISPALSKNKQKQLLSRFVEMVNDILTKP